MRGWFESTFGAGALAAQFVVALIVVIVLFAIIAAFARRRKNRTGPLQARGRQPRLAVMDMADIDERRKLLLIRRDNIEHLLMVGGPSDVVIESAIMRNRPLPHATERLQDRAMAAPAMPAHSRAQARAPSLSPAAAETASPDRPGDRRTVQPMRGPQAADRQRASAAEKPEETPQPATGPDRSAPATSPARPAAAPSGGPAAVAGLAAGAAALTAAAASAKRRQPLAEPDAPLPEAEKPPATLPVGPNGSDTTTPLAAAAAEAGPQAAAPEPAAKPTAPEPAATEDVAEGGKQPDGEKAAQPAPVPAAALTDEAPAEPVADTKPTAVEGVDTAAETQSEETPPQEAAEVDSADTIGIADDLAAALAPQQAQPADASAEVAEPAPAQPVEAATATVTEPEVEATGETLREATAEPVSDQSFDDIFGKQAGDGDTGADTSALPDTAAAPAPEKAAAPGNGETEPPGTAPEPAAQAADEPAAEAADESVAEAADEAAAEAADEAAATAADAPRPEPTDEQAAAVSPFPTIPEEVRRSVLEAARRASRPQAAASGPAVQADMAEDGEKTTLGDLAERLEQALAKQASTLSGQIKPTAEPDQDRAVTVEAWESGELPAAPPAAASADDAPQEPSRQSQAVLEGETDAGVIDFSDRKKASPESSSPESLEDEMARLLGELTGRSSGR